MIVMRWSLLIGGVVLMGLGTVFTITLIGAIIGVPLMIIGLIMAFVSIFVPTRVDPVIVTKIPGGETQRQIRCNKCSALNPDYAMYCNMCGNKLE
jgi:hypothetical protein